MTFIVYLALWEHIVQIFSIILVFHVMQDLIQIFLVQVLALVHVLPDITLIKGVKLQLIVVHHVQWAVTWKETSYELLRFPFVTYAQLAHLE